MRRAPDDIEATAATRRKHHRVVNQLLKYRPLVVIFERLPIRKQAPQLR